MKLIINADDFGLSRGTNYGIYEAHINGIVTSTTLMVTMPEVEHAIILAKKTPNLGIGLHLNMTYGKPLTDCRSLIKTDGMFYKPKENPNQDHFIEEEIYLEFKAQYLRFVQIMSRKPTHFDTHLYAHQIYDKTKNAIKKLACEVDVPVRDLESNFEHVIFLNWFKKQENINLKQLFTEKIADIENIEIAELMVHPAYMDHYLYEFSTYNIPRIEELAVLTAKEIKELIDKQQIELITYEGARRITCQK